MTGVLPLVLFDLREWIGVGPAPLANGRPTVTDVVCGVAVTVEAALSRPQA
jgi:hypothetical protein